ncbi:RICIN domain-containing protein [Teredinibacter franksiae]|uniref:RICIN domain-containing protein n=1 Tax=Teredinibacter franksiae TaxID=2761453 RepID=UPI001626E38F|nr:RICIN domain-containing protein [Teredinibacter franksiae]
MQKSLIWRLGALVSIVGLSPALWALDNGVYTIESKYSGKFVEIADLSTENSANVQQWSGSGHATQQWQITNISGDDYSLINVNSGKAMEVYNWDADDGANVVQYDYWGGESQLWTVTDQTDGYVSIINKFSGKALDLLNFDTADGANIAQWSWWGGDAQLWLVAPLQDPNVTISIEENQTGFCAVDGSVDTNNSGYSGSGFANTANASGNGVEWSLSIATAGNYTVQWRYANGGSSARPGDLLVDGGVQFTGVAFDSTGGWSAWVETGNAEVWLAVGTHQLRLEATSGSGLGNIDTLTVTGAAVSAGNCDGSVTPTVIPAAEPTPTPTAEPTPIPTPVPVDINFVAPGFTNIAVHDPSIIYENGQYYVFGSHLSAARSPDLMNWYRVADGVNGNNPLFNNAPSDLAEALSWAETTTLWAPGVYNLNGQLMMYYNACRGDSPLSAMGIATSRNVEGAYSNQGIFLRSGMWGQTSEDGTIFDALVHPNTVDPEVFSDPNGGLWMVYGSYSGGIFVMELDPSTGFPYSGQGYGTHVMGGNHARIEGAYVIHSPETRYYYMFSSFGGLGADGGYNIRVARATSPAGPYYDTNGTNMANVKSNPSLPLFDDASISLHGVKLVGNHLFSGTNNVLGYASPGHNSAYRKADTGQYFVIFHSRFPNRGEEHEIRVHEFHINADGWPVVSPLRYAEKIDSNNANRSRAELEAILASEVAGSYQLVNHGKDMSSNIKGSSDIQLNSNGTVSGSASGSWSFNESSRDMSVAINGVNFQGIVSRQWNQVRNRFEVVFSALSADGTAVWGIKSN